MSLRARPAASSDPSTGATTAPIPPSPPETPKLHPPPPPSPSLSQRALSQTLAGTANLANLLPTGTLLAFQLLTPLFTNNGMCDAATCPMTLVLLLLLAASCFLASFTDSLRSPDGQVFYGFATPKGLWLFDYQVAAAVAAAGTAGVPDLGKYRLSFIDEVHAVLSVLVFGAVALIGTFVATCFYPAPARETKEVPDIVPIGIGLICSLLFVVFPTRRHGIGYPVTPAGGEIK
ncbi:hypothetical protein NMG60_11036738 [Bertholletia excelsa]